MNNKMENYLINFSKYSNEAKIISKKKIFSKTTIKSKKQVYDTIFLKDNNKIKCKNYRINYSNHIILYIILYYIIINMVISLLKINEIEIIMNSHDSYITLKINSIGNIKVYYESGCGSSPPLPDYIYINEINQSEIKPRYQLNKTENSIKLIWKNNIDTATCMFRSCSKINEIDLSNFETSQITDMISMFYGCSSLKSINLSNLDTSHVTSMGAMFKECSSLYSLDLSNFVTSQVTDMSFMFTGCTLLNSLDLSNFNTTLVNGMRDMFSGCSSLSSLYLYNFNTSLVTDMSRMFDSCSTLEYLNLSSFDTSKVEVMYDMFHDCSSLKSLNLYNFDVSQATHMVSMFYGCTSLIFLNISNFYISHDTIIYSMFDGCASLEYIDLKNSIINITSYQDIFKGISENISIYTNDNRWNIFLKGYYINIKCNNISGNGEEYVCLKKNINSICRKCGNNYYPIYIDSNNNSFNINCYELSDGYYLDSYLLKPCYKTCKKCVIEGNETYHNCIECADNFPYIKKIEESYNNCYEKPSETNITLYKYNISKLINRFNRSYVDSGYNTEIKQEDIIYILTSTENQKNQGGNETIIDLGECENKLKSVYDISDNSSLYMVIIEKYIEYMKIPKIEYLVLYPLYNETFYQLDLKECEGLKIDVIYPVNISGDIDNIDEYNKSSAYYNDLCHKTTSNYGTDISLSDRKNNFVENNMTLCEEDCDLMEYNDTFERAKCSCFVKKSLPLIDDIKFDKDKLYKSFIDIKNIANINFMKCYKIVFKFENLKKNYGFYFHIFLFVLYFITLFLFSCKYFSSLVKIINKIKTAKIKILESKENNNNNLITNNNLNPNNRKKSIKELSKRKSRVNNMFPPKRKSVKKHKSAKRKSDSVFRSFRSLNSTNNNIEKYKEVLKYTDNELNSLEYKQAIISDKRTYSQYYFSLLKMGHPVIFSFYCNIRDYNIQIIKIFLFFFFISLDLTVNALFFSDDTMHKIYIDEGDFNFLYQLAQIIYSSLISMIISNLIKYLSLTESNIIDLKKVRKKEKINKNVKKLIKSLKIKFILFFIINFLLLLLFAYYIICFCCIYENTQIHLIKDTAISFALSLIYPFCTYLIPGIIRIASLHGKNKECLYKFSSFIQDIIV